MSSEYGKTKRSGNLFRTVLEHEEVEAGKVLHIGDNLISDYLMPKKCGMKSFLYRRV
ncbi:MAG: HAD-IA family hydrolase [Lachnospiraceae bacterium]|nr:HAD-IA family hydrolase [Lachnospiraceae bacterium]